MPPSIGQFLNAIGVPSSHHQQVWENVLDYDTHYGVTLGHSDIESLFPATWVETGVMMWHSSAMHARDPTLKDRFIYDTLSTQWALNLGTGDSLAGFAEMAAGQIAQEHAFSVTKTLVPPLLDASHWFLVIVTHQRGHPRIRILDSMFTGNLGSPASFPLRHQRAVTFIRRIGVHLFGWDATNSVPVDFPNVPQQSNSNDCGIFVQSFVQTIIEHDNIDALFDCAINDVEALWGTSMSIEEKRHRLFADVIATCICPTRRTCAWQIDACNFVTLTHSALT